MVGTIEEKMKGHFILFGYTQTLFPCLHSLWQGTTLIDEYTNDLSEMGRAGGGIVLEGLR